MDFASIKRKSGAATYGRRLRTAPKASNHLPSDDDASDDQRESAPKPSPKPVSPSKLSQTNKRAPVSPSSLTKLGSNSSVSPNAFGTNASPKKVNPLKKSASRSPRKATPSVSPKKRQSRAATPRKPAKDLGDIFEALSPHLNDSAVFSSQEDADESRLSQHVEDQESPIRPASQNDHLPTFERAQSPLQLASPTKRAKLAQRMAPRSLKRLSELASVDPVLSPGPSRPFRRIETDPLAGSKLADTMSNVSESRPGSLENDSGHESPHGLLESSRSLPGSPLWPEKPSPGSQEAPSSGRKRFAAMPRANAAGPKRTYGPHRSFLADRAEDLILQAQDSSTMTSNAVTVDHKSGHDAVAEEDVEDEVERQIRSALAPTSAATLSLSTGRSSGLQQASRESYSELLKKWGEDTEDIEWDESQDPTLSLKSITSLRSVGELRRFNDDLEYLFSGLDATQPLSLRRSSAVEFVRMLCGKPDTTAVLELYSDGVQDQTAFTQSSDFLRKLKASDGVVRVYDLFRGASAGDGSDNVLDAALAVFVGKLVKSPAMADPLLRDRCSNLVECLLEMLSRAERTAGEHRDGFLLLRQSELGTSRLGKSDRSVLRELRAMASLSGLFLSGSILPSLRSLLISILCTMSSLPKRMGLFAIQGMLQANSQAAGGVGILATMLQSFSREGDKARQRLTDYSRGLQLSSSTPLDTWPDLDVVDLCIRLMDKCMEAVYVDRETSLPFDNEALSGLVDICKFSLQSAPFRDEPDHLGNQAKSGGEHGLVKERSLQVLHGLTKWFLDLSQVDDTWGHALASSEVYMELTIQTMLLAESSVGTVLSVTQPASSALPPSSPPDGPESQKRREGTIFEDMVHLSLAVLTHLLIKQDAVARHTLGNTRLKPLCWRQRSCANSCSCQGKVSALSCLSQLFFRNRKTALERENADAAYLANSLATAMAQFAVGGVAFLDVVRSVTNEEVSTNRSGDGQSGFEELLDAVEEFAALHEAALRRDAQLAHDPEAQEGQPQQVELSEEPAQAKDEGVIGAEESGALIRELALELRRMARCNQQ